MDGSRRASSQLERLPEEVQQETEQMSIEHLTHLVKVLDKSDVSEIEVKHSGTGTRLVLRKARAGESATISVSEPVAEAADSSVSAPPQHTVTAPLVGIFHTWAKPKGKALVAAGDKVKVGQLVGSIQSLNVLYEIEASAAGRVLELLVEDGQPVEYGQALMTLETAEEA
ncbi:acetyl-CoA carboxylase biotin carboxyl carrier protein [Ktedonobacter racemifer]|uniref:Biotin/lipoyl attachment domain-containing protein n=1 Tax=Ktedonobacter racemifer DSM 44963 TaxID=485913 RepID=D6TL19_KTERA|nr:biotin/lipoyl-containing protein [Ktedonobacter racemifer]EFH86469.1 biotin/lipoyl attachment domain-containing protein [Ktedonobacter racemifer DSM 44963]